MSKFTIRVELHGVSDYAPLHTEMQKRSLFIIIQDDNTKKWYHLPPGEYDYIGPETTRDAIGTLVIAAVQAALEDETQRVKSLNNPPTYLITPVSGGRLWEGLVEVNAK